MNLIKAIDKNVPKSTVRFRPFAYPFQLVDEDMPEKDPEIYINIKDMNDGEFKVLKLFPTLCLELYQISEQNKVSLSGMNGGVFEVVYSKDGISREVQTDEDWQSFRVHYNVRLVESHTIPDDEKQTWLDNAVDFEKELGES